MARFLVAVLLFSAAAFSQCVSISDAPQHVGKKTCVAGKVLKVKETESGALLLHFCATDACPFVVRVLPQDREYVGDVFPLAGQEIEINGKIKQWSGRTEIILRDIDQLRGESAKLPSVPKTYDVERHGNYSPGQFKGNRTTKRSHKRPPKGPDEEIDTE
ncbi:MAG: hypothetical protein ACXVZX_07170 [Terriglobales bacterium]